tara:strand:+ start:1269 stop:1427 length:159 start_codon:yes stop_codon:yes gene_type:complete
MDKDWLINDIKNGLDNYSEETIIAIYNLLVKFDSNAKTSSLEEFIKMEGNKK